MEQIIFDKFYNSYRIGGAMNVRDLKKDQVVYEHYGRHNVRLTCMEDARDEGDRWLCNAADDDGRIVELMAVNGSEHYGPRLYEKLMYV